MNKKCVELLQKVINQKYHNIQLANSFYDEEEFYYEFNSYD